MVSRRDVIGQDALTNATYDPEAFGPEAVKFAAGKERTLPNGKPNPDVRPAGRGQSHWI
jgi:hypothetical protein